jgi:hypothetical protein
VHQLLEHGLVFILELAGIEPQGLALENVSREIHYVPVHSGRRYLRKIVLLVAHFVVKAQGGTEQTFAEWLERNRGAKPYLL